MQACGAKGRVQLESTRELVTWDTASGTLRSSIPSVYSYWHKSELTEALNQPKARNCLQRRIIIETITPEIDFAQAVHGLFDLSGQVAFVPGGYGGIGQAIAAKLGEQGAIVIGTATSQGGADSISKTLVDADVAGLSRF